MSFNGLIVFKPPWGTGGAIRYVSWLANTFNIPIYTLDEPEEPPIPEWRDAEVHTFGRKRGLPLIGRRIGGSFFDRVEYAFWKPPTEYDFVISSGLPTKSAIHHPGQSRVHLMHGFHKGAFGLPPRDRFSTNIIIELLQKYNRLSLRSMERYDLERADFLIANSEYTANSIDFYYNLPIDSVLNPPIDVESFYSNRSADDDFYLFLGNLSEYKNVEQIIKAFNSLSKPLVVAGSGPRKSELEELADSNIEFLGYVDEDAKRELLSKTKGLIQNSLAETFGVSTVEAMASGAPVIAVNEGNNPYLVEDEVNGLLYEPSQNIEQLCNAIANAENAEWDHDLIMKGARKYGYKEAEARWRDLLSSL